ncbi:PAN domain-containing protein [Agrobacterium vitis]|nr:PAN domain-containing protein [Agrobacterium vitis]
MGKAFRSVVSTIVGAVVVAVWSGSALGAEKRFGPFSINDAKPDVISMDGVIDAGSALNFRRVFQAAPNAKLITLNSPGGDVQMGLLIADDIHQRKFATYIPKESKCYSACSYVFLAGNERKVDGELGVHQISSDSPDLVGAQLAISDIIEVLNRFSTPMDVMQIMFKTPPDDMHVFTQDEIERYKLNRSGSEASGTPTTINIPAPTTGTASGTSNALAEGNATSPAAPAVSSAAPLKGDVDSQAELSPLEEFTKRVNRMVIYTGMDMFGDDISSIQVNDAGVCAQRCLAMNGQCKAFTFNANPKIKKGPNCFLKSSAGRADGNSVALSGRFLSAAEADPSSITLGTIDPQSSLFEDIDLPGGDLFRYPERSAQTPIDCRLTCIDDRRCIAFTYITAKKECWLKGAIGTPSFVKGMVSGVKKVQTFAPTKIISLD